MTENHAAEISIVLIQAGNFNRLMDETGKVFYDVYRMYLRTQDLVLGYAEAVYGTFVSIGNGRFMVFSTRSNIEPQLSEAQQLMDAITDLTKLSVHIGIGYGCTAREAERCARRALNSADRSMDSCDGDKEKNINRIVIVDAAGKVTEQLANSSTLSFEYRTENTKLLEKLTQCGIGVATYHRLLSVQHASAANALNSLTVADALSMTPRNARNILSSLESANLAKVVGKESSGPKGRPRNIYRIVEIQSRSKR
jgi:hypothetical protein